MYKNFVLLLGYNRLRFNNENPNQTNMSYDLLMNIKIEKLWFTFSYGIIDLNDRIENEGGSFDDWFKLIRSYLVLGENELAIERFNKAKDIFKEDNELIRQLENLIKDFNN